MDPTRAAAPAGRCLQAGLAHPVPDLWRLEAEAACAAGIPREIHRRASLLKRREAPIDSARMAVMAASDAPVGVAYHGSASILAPTSPRTPARPARRKRRSLTAPLTIEKSERSPRIADRLDAIAILMLWVTARTAGSESRAKIRSAN